jgi:hypothetical protein
MGWTVNEAAVELGAWEAGGMRLGGFQPLGVCGRLESAGPWGGNGQEQGFSFHKIDIYGFPLFLWRRAIWVYGLMAWLRTPLFLGWSRVGWGHSESER